ncbi:MAG: hypothetical protein CMI00_01495 [Oceanospirillaceae bacterium]|nr:hypothetical protein [Oceanospirillaceae bacterium]
MRYWLPFFLILQTAAGFLLSAGVAADEGLTRLCRGEMYEAGDTSFTPVRRRDAEVVDCALSKMNQSFLTQEKPWLRCIHEIRRGQFAGVYPLAQMSDLPDGSGVSDPISIEKWYWLTKGDLGDLSGLSFGAIRGSNQHAWLLSKGLDVEVEAASVEQLFKLLQSGRVDVIIGTTQELPLAAEQGIDHYFVRYLPLHAYFSAELLAQDDSFLGDFNSHLPQCQPDNWVELSENDMAKLSSLGQRFGVQVSLSMMNALQRQNQRDASLKEARIRELDAIWTGPPSDERDVLRDAVVASDVARELRKIKSQSDGIIVELMLIDRNGLLVAASELSTDYWQGDEDKFTASFGAAAGLVHVDEVRYDQSTRTFQSQLSMPLKDASGADAGVLMIGVDVEKALSEAPL